MHPDVWHVMRGRPYVIRLAGPARRGEQPIPGIDLAGVVEAVGASAGFRPGDEVFGETIRGLQWRNGGAFAEYAAAPEAALAPKPAGASFEQAAVVPTSGLIALQAVRARGARAGGAAGPRQRRGGGVGLFAVQLAKAFGAEVTGVDAPAKLELVRSFAPTTRRLHPRGLHARAATTSSSTSPATARSQSAGARSRPRDRT